MFPNIVLYFSLILLNFRKIKTTIDLNESELQYLADHLTPEECRRLVAAAHFKQLDEPKVLDKAEKCLHRVILRAKSAERYSLHRTSEPLEFSSGGRKRGDSRTSRASLGVSEGHRLRQMGKHELADWLGKTVFHELGQDLEKGLEKGLDEFLSEEITTENQNMTFPSLFPKIEDPTSYSVFDSVLYMIATGLLITLLSICFMIAIHSISAKIKKRKLQKAMAYDYVETDGTSESGSEDKFDVRTYTSNHHMTR